jgi:hypothetical protein
MASSFLFGFFYQLVVHNYTTFICQNKCFVVLYNHHTLGSKEAPVNLYSIKYKALLAMLAAAKKRNVVNGVAGVCVYKNKAKLFQVAWKQIGRIDCDPHPGETMAKAINYLAGGLAKYGQSVRTLTNSGMQAGEPKRGENNLRGCLITEVGAYTFWTFFSGHQDQDGDNAIAVVGRNIIMAALIAEEPPSKHNA